MKHSSSLIASVVVFGIAGCSVDAADPAESTAEGSQELRRAASRSGSTYGVPNSVLASYAFWNVSGPNIPADPPAQSPCSSPLDAVIYHVVGCMDANEVETQIPPSEATGVFCSANDGSGVTALQAACLGGWLMTIPAINGQRIPSNVVLTGANKVVSSVTRVVLLECPTPPAGLAQHNVIYKAVYNDGVFAPNVPAGCTAYELTPS
jgi:hypothetical protein